MRTLRLSLVGTVTLTLLGGLGAGVLAQAEEGSPPEAGIESEALFEITIPVDALPDELVKVNLEMHTVVPGGDASIGMENEAARAKALYVESGELVIEPMVDALVWRQEERLGGSPSIAAAAEAVRLQLGDLIFLPAIAAADVEEGAVMRIANPGSVPAVLLGFHTHEAGGTFPGWPAGVSGSAIANIQGASFLEGVTSRDLVFRLGRDIATTGEPLPVPEGAAFGLYFVESGQIDATSRGPGGENTTSRGPGSSLVTHSMDVLDWELQAAGDVPASVLGLAVIPSVAAPTALTEEGLAQAPSGATGISGTVTDTFVDIVSQGTVEGVTQYRGVSIWMVIEADDPRMSGEGMLRANRDTHEHAGVGLDVGWGTMRIENAEGAWEGAYSGATVEGVGGLGTWFVGEGDYEGLTAFTRAVTPVPDADGVWDFEGWIYPGDPPPMQ